MKTFISLLLFAFSLQCFGQLPEVSQRWYEKYIADRTELYGLTQLDTADYFHHDYSQILSNQLRFKGDGWSTYIGVFGPKNRRIDFHLKATKVKSDSYEVKGKSKLGNNIRALSGTFQLKEIWQYGRDTNIKFIVFEYELKEPGDRNGDGVFRGIGSIAVYLGREKPDILWAASGDFREYNNMFVGIWQRNDSEIEKECIFTFHPSGLETQLPFREHLYQDFPPEDECRCFYSFKHELKAYGWEGYEDGEIKKGDWWKNG